MIRRIMTESGIDVKAGLKVVLDKLENAFSTRSKEIIGQKPLLVAVSKTKPIEMIIDAYNAGQRHFGENYAKELGDKGSHQLLIESCPEIKWHFIGHLQRNNINKIINIPGLYMVETVDSEKLASALDKAWAKYVPNAKLKVLVQINTSDEENKSGVDPSEATNLYKFIQENCPSLAPEGVMTIGKFGHDYSTGPNPDFIQLLECHKTICSNLNLAPESVQISMGMSDDFEEAIKVGSTIVRVGSAIFGHRVKIN